MLLSYLSKAITMSGYLSPNISSDTRVSKNVSDSVRVLRTTGARYAGRSIFLWGDEQLLPQMLTAALPNTVTTHNMNPELILEAAIFEIVTKVGVESLFIPSFVFQAFQLVPENRTFNYSALLFPDGTYVNLWGVDKSVPDLTQLEARLWFFYMAAQYMSINIEALHMGQIMLMSKNDRGMLHTSDLLNKIRTHAMYHARRGFILCNAHVYEDPFVHFNFTLQLIFDFHAFPSRPVPNMTRPKLEHCYLKKDFENAIYGKSAGGISVSGWKTMSLPYLVELDNYDCTNHPGIQDPNDTAHPFGWDEISWYAHQSVEYRNSWLLESVKWLQLNDPVGYLEMPGMRCLCDSTFVDHINVGYYSASSGVDPVGFDQEDAIVAAWAL